jgi:lipopolysaccharide transport system ATP-binding protein
MSQLAIDVQNLSKQYRLGVTVSHRWMRGARVLRRARQNRADTSSDTIWALKDVSFKVNRGEVVGIIGRNGAGKSTLLKILSRITEPTEGCAEIHGRVGSLLEVGTGFNVELTGRENIFLSGAILGMPRREITRKLDAIVEFAEIAKFIDTPVKRYSSGMYMRLAFSVAAHLETDVLLVDEVLAVGDAEFQRKCLGRIEELGGTGRTVLFVSHSMASVLRLCPRVILLDGGYVTADGTASHVAEEYLGRGNNAAVREWPAVETAPGDDRVRLKAVRVVNDRGDAPADVDIREQLFVEVDYWNLSDDPNFRPFVNLHFFNVEGACLFVTNDANDVTWRTRPRRKGVVHARCHIPGNFFAEGTVFINAAVSSLLPTVLHVQEKEAVAFHVLDPSDGDGVRHEWVGDYPGILRPMLEWHVVEAPLA